VAWTCSKRPTTNYYRPIMARKPWVSFPSRSTIIVNLVVPVWKRTRDFLLTPKHNTSRKNFKSAFFQNGGLDSIHSRCQIFILVDWHKCVLVESLLSPRSRIQKGTQPDSLKRWKRVWRMKTSLKTVFYGTLVGSPLDQTPIEVSSGGRERIY
jgi:hypothetical protein